MKMTQLSEFRCNNRVSNETNGAPMPITASALSETMKAINYNLAVEATAHRFHGTR